MTLSVDDEVTIAEVAVILIGIVITWAVYRGATDESPHADPDATRDPGTESHTDPLSERRPK